MNECVLANTKKWCICYRNAIHTPLLIEVQLKIPSDFITVVNNQHY